MGTGTQRPLDSNYNAKLKIVQYVVLVLITSAAGMPHQYISMHMAMFYAY
jgi:hypothetical protein